jgi:hypothetical protein
MRREKAVKSILEAWAKLATTGVDFYLTETEKIQEAEELVRDAIWALEEGGAMADVRVAYKVWEQAWIESVKPQTLFK